MQAPHDEGDGPPPKKVPRRSYRRTHQQEGSTGSGALEERQSEEVAEGQATTSPPSHRGSRPVVEGPEQQASSAPVGQQYFVVITVALPFLSYIHPRVTNQYLNWIAQMHQDPVHFQVSVSGSNLQVRMQSSDRNTLRNSAIALHFQLKLLKYVLELLIPGKKS